MSVSTFDETKVRRDAGGQFAEKPGAAESGVSLDGPSGTWQAETGVSPQELLDMARRSAAYMARRYQIDQDELAAETVAYYLNQVANGSRQGTLRDGDERKTQSHIRAISKGLAQRIASGHKHGGPNLTAVTSYLKQREDYESRTGLKMTATQEDDLANRIRDNWEGSRKPDTNFHRARSLNGEGNVSLDAVRTEHEGSEVKSMFGTATSAEDEHLAEDTEFAPGSAGENAERMATSTVAAERREARRALWSVLASTHDAPEVRRDSITSAQAGQMRADVASHGPVHSLITKFNNGQLSEVESNALFAPWGDDARRGVDQDRIVDTLSVRRSMAGDVWDAAVDTATRSRSPRKR